MVETRDCVFCKMIRGEEKCYKLYEDETTLCIVDVGQVITDEEKFILIKLHCQN